MGKPNDKQNNNEVVRNGELSPEELQNLKDKLQVKDLFYIEVKMDAEGKDYACGYIKPINDRNILATVVGKVAKQDKVGAGEYILANCWAAGDERLRTHNTASVSAAIEALESVELLESSSKKV